MRFFTIFLLFVFTGCGFLDEDIFLDDEAYEKKIGSESIELDAMSIHGQGSLGSYGFGCGGSYSFSHGSRYGFGTRASYRKGSLSRNEAQEPADETNETAEENEAIVAVDSRSSLVRLIDSYGAKKHTLNARLP